MSPAVGALPVPDQPDHVYDEIRRAVIEGRYPPGFRLVEQRLAEELRVSRTPVREALRRLESDGLVVVQRHRGAEVRGLTAAEIADLYDARARLEAYAAELAAERATAEDVAALDAAVQDFEAAVADVVEHGPDLARVRRLDAANAAFHGGLLTAGRHSRLRQLVNGTVDVPLVFQALRHFGAQELHRSAMFHGLIRDAVAAREPARAGRLMAEHVLQGRDALLERLQTTEVRELFALEQP
ncbi:MAG: GntR family transcriptional regulator [Mycobacteriales bacterium]